VERVRLESLGDRRLLVTDLSDLGPDEAPTILQRTHLLLAGLPKQRTVLSLAIVRGLRMDARVTEEMKRVWKSNAPWVAASAIVGMSAIGRVLARGVAMVSGRTFQAFGSEAEARAWLANSAHEAA
jgi:hypothetical protein